jgi:hypothetical protein
MKKLVVFAFAALLVFAFTVPATADVEHLFGGYWRTRMIVQENFTGTESDYNKTGLLNPALGFTVGNNTSVDTRTRLYYTAVLNENLKLINKFEIDAVWGQPDELGDIGADGKVFEVKNSYAEFNLNEHIFRVGVQGWTFQRGFLFADDGAGILWMYTSGNIMHIAAWLKFAEMDLANHDDLDVYGYAPFITLSEGFTVQPYFVYAYSGNIDPYFGSLTTPASAGFPTGVHLETSAYYIGVDIDQKTDAFSWWGTAIYLGGDLEWDREPAGFTTKDIDISAYLFAIGGSIPIPASEIHGQFFYATGDELTSTGALKDPDESNTFGAFEGQSYYWAEILGYGIFDQQVSHNSPGDKIGNIMAANIGITLNPAENMTLVLDLWWAQLVEERFNALTVKNPIPTLEDDLGIEIDARLTTQLVEGLTLDVVAAYLAAGDATGDGEENPIEVGAQLSLSF